MKKLILFQILCAAVLFAQNAEFNYSQMNYGTLNTYASASELALANSGIAGGSALSAMILNPALAAKSTQQISFRVGMAMNLVEEDRAYPYYDTYGGFTDYGSYSFNKSWYPSAYGVLNYAIPVPGLQKFVVSSGYLPFIDYSYNYVEEVGYPNSSPEYKKDKILGYNTIESEGRLYQIPLGFSLIPMDNLSAGVQFAVLQGELDQQIEMLPQTDLFTDDEETAIYRNYKYGSTLKNMPIVTSFGVNYAINEHLQLGLSSRMPFKVEYETKVDWVDASMDTTVTGVYDLQYPAQVGFGLEYRFTNILEARILLDVIYDFCNSFEDSRDETLDFNDTYTVRVGVEHNFFNDVPLRVGFSYETLKENKDFSKTLLTIGSGFKVQDVAFNFALGFSSLQYYQYDLFDDAIYGMVNRGTELDRVQQSEFFGRVDVSYAFSFGK